MGCLRSGARPASLVPTIVMTDESASERLFTASSVMAMECERVPTTALKPASRTLATIPVTLARTIAASRPVGGSAPSRLALTPSGSVPVIVAS